MSNYYIAIHINTRQRAEAILISTIRSAKVSEFKIVSASEGDGVLGGTLSQARENEVCGGLDAIQGMLVGRSI